MGKIYIFLKPYLKIYNSYSRLQTYVETGLVKCHFNESINNADSIQLLQYNFEMLITRLHLRIKALSSSPITGSSKEDVKEIISRFNKQRVTFKPKIENYLVKYVKAIEKMVYVNEVGNFNEFQKHLKNQNQSVKNGQNFSLN
ncbi:uncharacterized protein KGF55_000402 [Candida pseudojiufengensis]|uniref:uncharacterized protein n=1 Tax=Candida pseudojiufengensis TaxID=497109 RepID=UPI0022254CC9|nr:uncharacterized protein KGF55_000402 [Candida pseudojiufengensis]KAI5966993.1 hypothetical protein KGF55_000402 [Candida pseudojiufengensis]